MYRGALAARLRRDEGFGLIEATVALVIIFGLILVLMRTFDTSVRVLVETRRAAAANAFATELIERAQALEWRHMGLAASTNGTSCATGQVGCADFLAEFPELAANGTSWDFDGEPMVFTNSDTFKPFLAFHEQVDRDGTDFDRYIFVTSVDEDGDGAEDLRRLTAVVRWTPPGGFPRSVEQAALVSPFTRPSQPLIRTDVSFSGGSVDVSGASGPDALASGSQWPTPSERSPFQAGVTLPAIELTAMSDYVSEGRARVAGTSVPLLAWAGADGVVGTADDTRASLDPTELVLNADDDPLSTPMLVEPTTTATAPGVVQTGTYPEDLFLVQIGRTDPLDGGTASDGTMVARVAAEDDQGTADGLPFAAAEFTGSEKTVVGFLEYGDTASRTFYEGEWGTAFPFSSFGFSLYRRADRVGTSVLDVAATADRVQTGAEPTTTGTVAFSSPPIELLRDDVLDLADPNSDFLGWVVIEPASVAVSGITAGVNALALPDPVTAGTLRVRVWDPAANAYVDTDIDYDTFGGSCDSVPAPIEIPVGSSGSPLTAEVNTSPLPWLTYEVSGTVTVNPWCTDIEFDPSNAAITTESVFETVGPMVTATLTYEVLDNGPLFDDPNATPITLYDLTLDVVTDSMDITSVYATPETTP